MKNEDSKQMDSCGNSRTSSPLQYRYGILLVYLQPGNRRLYRLFQKCNGMGFQLCHLFPWHVCCFSGQCSGKGYSSFLSDCSYLLCSRHGRYRLFHLVRRRTQRKSDIINRYLCMLRLYYGYRTGNRLSVSR